MTPPANRHPLWSRFRRCPRSRGCLRLCSRLRTSSRPPAARRLRAGLAEVYPRRCQVVELRYFGGLNNREIGDVLGVSEATVEREWRFARAWLYRELERQ